MEPAEELRLILLALNKLRKELYNKSSTLTQCEILDYYMRISTLSYCLENINWKVVGNRDTDNLKL